MSTPIPGSRTSTYLPAGTRLNDTYELDQGIAAGGMGEIYRGHNIQTGSSYAIKMIRSDVADTDGAMTMFLREASALNDLFHEAIVRYFAFSVDPSLRRPYMVMEFVSGRSLSDIVKAGPLDYESVRTLGMRLSAGLQVAHTRGIIHRDISPDNIILPNDDVSKAKIIDFGIARQTQSSEGTIIGDGFAGKYNYVSPEQLGMFGGDVGPASDIYSLGLVLAEVLAGYSINMRGNQFEVVEKRRSVPDLRHIDTRMQMLLTEMLQPDPNDRPETMTEVGEKLRRQRGTSPPRYGDDFDHGGETVIQSPMRSTSAMPSRAPSSASVRPSRAPWPAQEVSRRDVPGPGGNSESDTIFDQPYDPGTGRKSSWVSREVTGDRSFSKAPSAAPVYQREQSRKPVYVTAPPSKKSGSGVFIAVGVLVLLLAGGGGFWYWQQMAGQKQQDVAKLEPAKQDKPAGTTGGQTIPGDPAKTANPVNPAVHPGVLRQVDLQKILASYSGGPCFFANPILISDAQVTTEGFGKSIVPFERFDQAFEQKTGIEPDIRLRQVVDAQCPVVDFLASTRADDPSRPRVEVVNSAVKVGDLIVGEASAPNGLYLAVLLVGDDGGVTVLARSDTPDGTPVPFQATATRETDGGGKPGLILAIASPHPFDSLTPGDTAPANQTIAKLTADSASRNDRLASAVQYVVLQR